MTSIYLYMKRLQQKVEGHALIHETVKFEFESTVYNLYYRSYLGKSTDITHCTSLRVL